MKKTKLVGALLAGVIATTGVPGLVQPMSVSVVAASKLAAPAGLKATASQTSVKLTWSAVSGADAYRVFILNDRTGKYETAKNVSGTTANISGLKAGKTYKFKVAALVKSGSGYKVQTASAAAAVNTLLAAPTGLTASASGSTITLSWKAVSGAGGYRVFVYDSGSGSYKALKDVSGTSASVKVTSGGTYKYKVAATLKKGGKTSVQTQSGAVKVNVKVADTSAKKKFGISFPAFGTSRNATINAMGLKNGMDLSGFLNSKAEIGAYGGYKNINGDDCMVILYFNKSGQFFYGLIQYSEKAMSFSDLFNTGKAAFGNDYISFSAAGVDMYEWADLRNKQVKFIFGAKTGAEKISMYGEMSINFTPQEMLSGNNDITGALTDISSLLNPQ